MYQHRATVSEEHRSGRVAAWCSDLASVVARLVRFTVLYSGVTMNLASTEHMGTQSQSGFYCSSTSTQQTWVIVSGLPAVSVNYIDLLPSRLVLLGIHALHSAYTRKIAQNVQKSLADGAPPQTPPGELTTLPQTL